MWVKSLINGYSLFIVETEFEFDFGVFWVIFYLREVLFLEKGWVYSCGRGFKLYWEDRGYGICFFWSEILIIV